MDAQQLKAVYARLSQKEKAEFDKLTQEQQLKAAELWLRFDAGIKEMQQQQKAFEEKTADLLPKSTWQEVKEIWKNRKQQ